MNSLKPSSGNGQNPRGNGGDFGGHPSTTGNIGTALPQPNAPASQFKPSMNNPRLNALVPSTFGSNTMKNDGGGLGAKPGPQQTPHTLNKGQMPSSYQGTNGFLSNKNVPPQYMNNRPPQPPGGRGGGYNNSVGANNKDVIGDMKSQPKSLGGGGGGSWMSNVSASAGGGIQKKPGMAPSSVGFNSSAQQMQHQKVVKAAEMENSDFLRYSPTHLTESGGGTGGANNKSGGSAVPPTGVGTGIGSGGIAAAACTNSSSSTSSTTSSKSGSGSGINGFSGSFENFIKNKNQPNTPTKSGGNPTQPLKKASNLSAIPSSSIVKPGISGFRGLNAGVSGPNSMKNRPNPEDDDEFDDLMEDDDDDMEEEEESFDEDDSEDFDEDDMEDIMAASAATGGGPPKKMKTSTGLSRPMVGGGNKSVPSQMGMLNSGVAKPSQSTSATITKMATSSGSAVTNPSSSSIPSSSQSLTSFKSTVLGGSPTSKTLTSNGNVKRPAGQSYSVEMAKKQQQLRMQQQQSKELQCSKCGECFSTKEARRLHTCNSILDAHFLSVDSSDRLRLQQQQYEAGKSNNGGAPPPSSSSSPSVPTATPAVSGKIHQQSSVPKHSTSPASVSSSSISMPSSRSNSPKTSPSTALIGKGPQQQPMRPVTHGSGKDISKMNGPPSQQTPHPPNKPSAPTDISMKPLPKPTTPTDSFLNNKNNKPLLSSPSSKPEWPNAAVRPNHTSGGPTGPLGPPQNKQFGGNLPQSPLNAKLKIKLGSGSAPSSSVPSGSRVPPGPSSNPESGGKEDGYAFSFAGRPTYSPSRVEPSTNIPEKETPRDATNKDSPASQADSGVFSIASSSSPSKGDVTATNTSPDSPNRFPDQQAFANNQWKQQQQQHSGAKGGNQFPGNPGMTQGQSNNVGGPTGSQHPMNAQSQVRPTMVPQGGEGMQQQQPPFSNKMVPNMFGNQNNRMPQPMFPGSGNNSGPPFPPQQQQQRLFSDQQHMPNSMHQQGSMGPNPRGYPPYGNGPPPNPSMNQMGPNAVGGPQPPSGAGGSPNAFFNSNAEPPMKRKRGRPRKNPLKEGTKRTYVRKKKDLPPGMSPTGVPSTASSTSSGGNSDSPSSNFAGSNPGMSGTSSAVRQVSQSLGSGSSNSGNESGAGSESVYNFDDDEFDSGPQPVMRPRRPSNGNGGGGGGAAGNGSHNPTGSTTPQQQQQPPSQMQQQQQPPQQPGQQQNPQNQPPSMPMQQQNKYPPFGENGPQSDLHRVRMNHHQQPHHQQQQQMRFGNPMQFQQQQRMQYHQAMMARQRQEQQQRPPQPNTGMQHQPRPNMPAQQNMQIRQQQNTPQQQHSMQQQQMNPQQQSGEENCSYSSEVVEKSGSIGIKIKIKKQDAKNDQPLPQQPQGQQPPPQQQSQKQQVVQQNFNSNKPPQAQIPMRSDSMVPQRPNLPLQQPPNNMMNQHNPMVRANNPMLRPPGVNPQQQMQPFPQQFPNQQVRMPPAPPQQNSPMIQQPNQQQRLSVPSPQQQMQRQSPNIRPNGPGSVDSNHAASPYQHMTNSPAGMTSNQQQPPPPQPQQQTQMSSTPQQPLHAQQPTPQGNNGGPGNNFPNPVPGMMGNMYNNPRPHSPAYGSFNNGGMAGGPGGGQGHVNSGRYRLGGPTPYGPQHHPMNQQQPGPMMQQGPGFPNDSNKMNFFNNQQQQMGFGPHSNGFGGPRFTHNSGNGIMPGNFGGPGGPPSQGFNNQFVNNQFSGQQNAGGMGSTGMHEQSQNFGGSNMQQGQFGGPNQPPQGMFGNSNFRPGNPMMMGHGGPNSGNVPLPHTSPSGMMHPNPNMPGGPPQMGGVPQRMMSPMGSGPGGNIIRPQMPQNQPPQPPVVSSHPNTPLVSPRPDVSPMHNPMTPSANQSPYHQQNMPMSAGGYPQPNSHHSYIAPSPMDNVMSPAPPNMNSQGNQMVGGNPNQSYDDLRSPMSAPPPANGPGSVGPQCPSINVSGGASSTSTLRNVRRPSKPHDAQHGSNVAGGLLSPKIEPITTAVPPTISPQMPSSNIQPPQLQPPKLEPVIKEEPPVIKEEPLPPPPPQPKKPKIKEYQPKAQPIMPDLPYPKFEIEAPKPKVKHEIEKSDFVARWEELPEKVIKRILQFGVLNEGAIPLLVRASRVCKKWHSVTQDRSMWTHLNLSAGNLKEKYRNDKKLQDFLGGFPNVLEIKLTGWKNTVGTSTLKMLSTACPKLKSLGLAACFKLTNEDLKLIGDSFLNLERLDLSNVSSSSCSSRSAVSSTCLSEFIVVMGKRLTHLNISNNKMSGLPFVFKALSAHSSNLEELDISNITTTSRDTILINVEKFQKGCQKLRVLNFNHTMISLSDSSVKEQVASLGFPNLRELHIAVDSRGYFDGMDDSHIERMLKNSSKLRVFDVRGCQQVTDSCLIRLPSWDIEKLVLSGCSAASGSADGLELIVKKWAGKLIEVDMSMTTHDKAVSYAIGEFADADDAVIRKLNLCNTSVSIRSLTRLLKNCFTLEYLNLVGCRGLHKDIKKLHSTREAIEKLRDDIVAGKFDGSKDDD